MRSLCLIMLGLLVAGNSKTNPTTRAFVLNEAKPYVYIAFDHSGERKPLGPNEDKRGFWLRFVNNCSVPVTLGTFETGTNDPGVGVFYDVVPFPVVGIGGSPSPQERAPSKPAANSAEAPAARAEEAPEGYYAEVGSVTTVPSGGSVLFSVPSNHLSSRWYLRVRFTLAVSPNKIGDQPYSYADFRWEQVPTR